MRTVLLLSFVLLAILPANTGATAYCSQARVLAVDTEARIIYVYDPYPNTLTMESYPADYSALDWAEVSGDRWYPREELGDFERGHVVYRGKYLYKYFDVYETIAWKYN